MLGYFNNIPWCQTNPILTRPKKDSINQRIIMDLSWKINLPLALDMSCFIWNAGRGAYLYSADVAMIYRQLSLDVADWPRVRFQFEGRFFTDRSLLFGLAGWLPITRMSSASSPGSLGGMTWPSLTTTMTSKG